MYLNPTPEIKNVLDVFELASGSGLAIENIERKLPDIAPAEIEKIVDDYAALMAVPYHSCGATITSIVVKAERAGEVRAVLGLLASTLNCSGRIDGLLTNLRRPRLSPANEERTRAIMDGDPRDKRQVD